MWKMILFLLYYGLSTVYVSGQINSDPAPGRSPGPPGMDTILQDDHGTSIEDSPILLLTKDDTFSNGSSDEVEEVSVASLLRNEARSSENSHAQSLNDAEDRSSIDEITKLQPVKIPNDKDSHDNTFFNRKKSPDETQSDSNKDPAAKRCANQLSDYIQTRDQIITIEDNINGQNQNKESENFYDIRLDIVHDIFDVSQGITCGLMYQVNVMSSIPMKIQDFFVQSLSGNSPRGSFIRNTNGKNLSAEWLRTPFASKNINSNEDTSLDQPPSNSWEEDYSENIIHHQLQNHWSKIDGLFPKIVKSASRRGDTDCLENTWHGNFSGETKVTSNWIVNEYCEEDGEVVFMIFYRLAGNNSGSNEDSITVAESNEANFSHHDYRNNESRNVGNKIFKKVISLKLNKECHLKLHHTSGSLDYTSLPLYSVDCVVHFPSRQLKLHQQYYHENNHQRGRYQQQHLQEEETEKQGGKTQEHHNLYPPHLRENVDENDVKRQNPNQDRMEWEQKASLQQQQQRYQRRQHPPGLLIQLTRLNVPCDSGGFIRFSNGSTLCGKLEELTDSERTYHFTIHRNTSVTIHKNPMFSLHYQLVDYCYNMTLSDRNGSFFLQTVHGDTLQCYFRIHLPFGNRVELTLVTNNISDLHQSDNSNNNNKNSDDEKTYENLDISYMAHINISLSNSNSYSYINNTITNANTGSKSISHSNSKNDNNNNNNNNNVGVNRDSSGAFIGLRESDSDSGASKKCDGLLVRIYDTKLFKWSYCIRDRSDVKKFSLISQSNTLVLYVAKSTSSNLPKTQTEMGSSSIPQQSSEQVPNGKLGQSNMDEINMIEDDQESTVFFSYSARPIPEIISECAFGWVAIQQFCVKSVETALSWHQAEQQCANYGGHLASIRSEIEQTTIDQLLLNSPGYGDNYAYWVGASDSNFEGDFRWTDGSPFLFTNWFPGWPQHGNYNKQPNDDGLSGQDCVEIRRHFRLPPGVQTTKAPLSSTYMWNDRDCEAKNFFICERPIDDEPIENDWAKDCNKTISLTKEHPRASLWSPSFPRQYPDNANCYSTVTAPSGYRIVLEFEELVIENEPGCSYDYLEITEPTVTHTATSKMNIDTNYGRTSSSPLIASSPSHSPSPSSTLSSSSTSRHGLRKNTYRKRNSYDSFSTLTNNLDTAQSNYQNMLNVFTNLYKPRSNFLIQTPDYPRGNPYYSTSRNRDNLPRRMCGDWSSKLKLLRHVSGGSYLGLHFVSDYSHHYGGFKAKVFMENRGQWFRAGSECSDERLKPYNGSCYLFVSYPEVDWWTAQQVCRGVGAQLSSVSSADEHRFITASIRNQADYSPQLIYWLGGELASGKQYEWTDDTKMDFQGWLPGQGQFDEMPSEPICLGLQWKMSPTPMLPSGLYWDSQKCRRVGGYVCKKRKQPTDQFEVKNETVNGVEGRLTSPGYPNPYPLNIDYWVRIAAPEKHRIVVQFQKIDLEPQDECLYDYVSIQNYETSSRIFLEPGSNPVPMAMLTWDKTFDDVHSYYYTNDRLLRFRRSRRSALKNFVYERWRQGGHNQQDNDLIPSSKQTILHQKKSNIKNNLVVAKDKSSAAVSDTLHQENEEMKENFFDGFQLYRKRRRKKRFTDKNPEKLKKRSIGTGLDGIDYQEADNAPSFLPYVRWCGSHDANMTKFDFVSASNEITLNFHSDYSISGLGFSAVWKAIDISGCPYQTLTAREGVVFSPNHPYFMINNIDCIFTIQAPIGRKVWLRFDDFEVNDGALITVDIGNGAFLPYRSKNHINEGMFVSHGEQIKIQLKTSQRPRGRGFRATYWTVSPPEMERIINVNVNSTGSMHYLNYPQVIPGNIDFTQHLVAPLGEVILLELYGVEFSQNGCPDQSILEVFDNYADHNGTRWQLCKFQSNITKEFERMTDERLPIEPNQQQQHQQQQQQAPIYITSYLNTLHIRQKTSIKQQIGLNATIHIQQDVNYKLKLASGDDSVESCLPNPCQFDGKCITKDAKRKTCQCHGHYTGRFCALTMCELEPCLFGKCELTATNFKCHCQTGYIGSTCEQKQKPCADNPCEGRGVCSDKNGAFHCFCHAWWEGPRCERRMLHIPYKPLSERMLQEPFWLGLITVFVVLAVIGLVWCAKRHFPEKIEKLLAEEADRNRPPGSVHGHHHHTSLREQLQFTTSIPQATATTPGAPRSIFNRLGIRKPSILSLSSPNPPGGATARTFSLDDLLRPPPRRSPSPRKKRNNSTPTKKNAAEKKQILQQLVSPAATQARPKITLGELIQMSENRLKVNAIDSESDLKETTFSENSGSASTSTTRPIAADPKLEKKVTFARLLSKVSAEMSSGSEVDIGNGTHNSSALSLPTEIQYRANSVPQSPCTNDTRSPHSTSSNQGSDSLSSSELALTELGLRNIGGTTILGRNRIRPKVSSADSILAMFRNFASATATAAVGLSTSSIPNSSVLFISPSTTPTACSPQDDAPGDDESSTSSIHTPVSFSSGPPDSPVFYRQTTIEVPVLDALSAHKTTPNTNLLHPPTILLEIPSNGINKCLSPIRELPTPIPSPALTPIMPRPQRSSSPIIRDDQLSGSGSEDEDHSGHYAPERKAKIMAELHEEMNRMDSEVDTTPTDTTTTSMADINRPYEHGFIRGRTNSLVPNITIDIEPPTPEERGGGGSRPRDLVIPTLTVEQPSPTRNRFPMIIFPGSPPPQRASIGETSFMFPNKQQQKRLLKQFEKPTSLDLPFVPPMITITSNLSEMESDAEPLSPAPTSKIPGATTLVAPGGGVGMCYLSPFAICTRADRTISESNLSSSGYSSMASPGPSRCGSSNPLCPNEMDEPGGGPPGTNLSLHANLLSRRQSSLLASCKENVSNGKSASGAQGNHERLRGRSDSETLSDDALLESNDEGIGTDHLDEKIEEGEIKSAKELEIYIGKELLETGKSILCPEESAPMSQLQLPSIVIQAEGGDKGLSPVSSRSESPLSERAGIGRFSPHFYGRKDQQLPFTDSDGLYDFPSSDGKGTTVGHQRRSSGKKRDRKASRAGLTQSPTRNPQHLDLPTKELSVPGSHSCSKHFHHHHHPHHASSMTARKSPKRRPVQRHPVASSSSSTESLTSARELTLRPAKVGSPGREKYLRKREDGSGDDTGEDVSSQILPNVLTEDIVRPRKTSRLRAIGNQIRFLRRLEKSIKRREKLLSPSDSCAEDGNDDQDSPRITSPLLQNCTKPKMSLCRQKRLPSNLFTPLGTTTVAVSSHDRDWRARHRIHGDFNSD